MPKLTSEQAVRAYDYLNNASIVVEKHNDGKDWVTITSETTEELATDWLIGEGVVFVARGAALPLTAFCEIFFGGGELATGIPNQDWEQELRDSTKPFTMEGKRLVPNLFQAGRTGLVSELAYEHLLSANAFMDTNNYQNSINEYNKALSLIPSASVIHYYRAQAHSNLGNNQQAYNDIQAYREIVPLDESVLPWQNIIHGKLGEEYMNRGHSLLMAGNYQEAINEYNKALSLIPSASVIHYYRAQAHSNLGNNQQAYNDIQAYREIVPLDESVLPWQNIIHGKLGEEYMNRGHSLLMAGNYQEAINEYNIALSLIPSASVIYYYRAQAHSNLGNNQQAYNDIQAYRGIMPLDQSVLPLYNIILKKVTQSTINSTNLTKIPPKRNQNVGDCRNRGQINYPEKYSMSHQEEQRKNQAVQEEQRKAQIKKNAEEIKAQLKRVENSFIESEKKRIEQQKSISDRNNRFIEQEKRNLASSGRPSSAGMFNKKHNLDTLDCKIGKGEISINGNSGTQWYCRTNSSLPHTARNPTTGKTWF